MGNRMAMSESDWGFIDLSLLVLYIGGVVFALVVGIPNPYRTALAIPLLIFVPGYAAIATIYPDRGGRYKPFDDSQTGLNNPIPPDQGLTGVERGSLSVVTSLIITPVVALVATASPWGIAEGPILVGLSIVTLAFSLLAILRRWQCVPERRFDPAQLGGIFYPPRRGRRSRNVRIFNIALLVSMLILAGSIGYAFVDPPQSEGYTEFYVDTSDVTGDVDVPYEASFTAGSSNDLGVNIVNQEGSDVEYTTVVSLQQVSYGDSSVEVHSEDELLRESITVSDGAHENQTLSLTPSMSGDDLRLLVLLYEGEPPDEPTVENAYRELSLPVVVN